MRPFRVMVLVAIFSLTCGCIPAWHWAASPPPADQVSATLKAPASAPDDFLIGLESDARGRLWYLDSPSTSGVTSPRVSVYDPRTTQIRSTTIPGEVLSGLAVGRDGTIWVARPIPWGLIRVDPVSMQATDVTSHLPAGTQPGHVAASADGTIWFTDRTGAIDRINPHTLEVLRYPLPQGSAKPGAIVIDRGTVNSVLDDGTLARLDIETGAFDLVPGGATSHLAALDVTALPDGTLWWAESQQHELVRFDPRTHHEEIVPLGIDRTPYSVKVGPDGALWVTETCVDHGLLRIDPRTLAKTEYLQGIAGTEGMVMRRGHLWFLGASADGYGLFEVNGVGPFR